MRSFLVLLALFALGGPLHAADTRRLADELARELRALQNEDGTYGEGLLDTCRVLDLFARSPRRYTDLDGPFVRRAVAAVLAAEDDPKLDGWRALALSGCLDPEAVRVREALVDRLLERAARDWGSYEYEEILAINLLRPDEAPRPPQHIVNSGNPAIRLLLAQDPSRVPPPRLREAQRWARWARAARLRGVTPEEWPDAPESRSGRSLAELCDDLNLVLAVHGLRRPGDLAGPAEKPEPPPFVSGDVDRPSALRRALSYLEAQQEDGTFGLAVPGWEGPEPGVTALSLSAALTAAAELGLPRPTWIDAGLDWLVGLQDKDGAIALYGVRVYTTSVAIEALLDGGREKDQAAIERGVEFLRVVQSDEGEGYEEDLDSYYGGIGYGNDERPDLSNTQMALEALHRAGVPPDDDVFRKALVFLRRNHNFSEEQVDRWPRAEGGEIVSGGDGGAMYYPGRSEAGEDPAGEGVWVARSYGSMTYALTKSYLLCGLPPEHARVRAAVNWLLDNFVLDRNPGFDAPKTADGLYYYYLAMARTLSRLPDESLSRAGGPPLAWREAMNDHLLRHQRTDGSWTNDGSGRWYEGSPTLCTAYALLSLAAAADG